MNTCSYVFVVHEIFNQTQDVAHAAAATRSQNSNVAISWVHVQQMKAVPKNGRSICVPNVFLIWLELVKYWPALCI